LRAQFDDFEMNSLIEEVEVLIDQSKWAEVIELLDLHPGLVEKSSERLGGVSLLHLATCYDGAADLVKYLLMCGVDPNSVAADGATPLGNAIYSGHRCGVDTFDIVCILVSGGADLRLVDDTGNPPLHSAIKQRRLNVVKYLLEKGADPFQLNIYGEAALSMINDWLGPDFIAGFPGGTVAR
jgi:ankyrin repeat protein